MTGCRICGSALPPGAMFCGECGAAANPAVAGVAEETADRLPKPVDREPALAASYIFQFSTGEVVTLTAGALIGRNPVPQPGERVDDLVCIHDPAKSVSKTHLEVGVEDGRLWASDRYSGNGTVLRRADGTVERCAPGKRYRVFRGDRLDLGEQFAVVS
jgi:hypothetical protein